MQAAQFHIARSGGAWSLERDRCAHTAIGRLLLCGHDGLGNAVYVAGYGKWRSLAMRSITGLLGIFWPCSSKLLVCDVASYPLLPPRRSRHAAEDVLMRICTGEPPQAHPADVSRKTVFFHCYGSSHTSVVEACLHLGLLPELPRPSYKQLMQLPHFDKVIKSEIGMPMFMGYDSQGRAVYTLGLGRGREPLRRLLKQLLLEIGIPGDRVRFFDCLGAAGLLTRIGGFLSRGLGLTWLGRPLVVYSVILNWEKFCELHRQIELQLGMWDGELSR